MHYNNRPLILSITIFFYLRLTLGYQDNCQFYFKNIIYFVTGGKNKNQ